MHILVMNSLNTTRKPVCYQTTNGYRTLKMSTAVALKLYIWPISANVSAYFTIAMDYTACCIVAGHCILSLDDTALG